MSRLASVLAFTEGQVRPASEWLPAQPSRHDASWTLPALSGRLIELAGGGATANLSLAFSLVDDAQQRREPVAWVVCHGSNFFPPDAAACGIDLGNLPVVFAPAAPHAARAAERLVRSGAFGLVVIDIAGESASIPQPLLTRLAGLAEKHECTTLILTDRDPERTALGSLISLRATAQRRTLQRRVPGRYACRLEVLKDKRHPPGWTRDETRLGPPGL
jgi:recombination protein RecA